MPGTSRRTIATLSLLLITLPAPRTHLNPTPSRPWRSLQTAFLPLLSPSSLFTSLCSQPPLASSETCQQVRPSAQAAFYPKAQGLHRGGSVRLHCPLFDPHVVP